MPSCSTGLGQAPKNEGLGCLAADPGGQEGRLQKRRCRAPAAVQIHTAPTASVPSEVNLTTMTLWMYLVRHNVTFPRYYKSAATVRHSVIQ